MNNLKIKSCPGGVILAVKVVPNSSRTAVIGLLDGMLKVKVASPAEKGSANQCLVKFLAETFGVKRNAVSIVTGPSSPVKQVQILGVSADEILSKVSCNCKRTAEQEDE